jgi:hypothetical protein
MQTDHHFAIIYASPRLLSRSTRPMLLNKPLHNTLITQDILPKTLHHAQPLMPEILHSLLHQILIIAEQPAPIDAVATTLRLRRKEASAVFASAFVDVHGTCLALATGDALSLEHVDDGVDGAEGSRAAAAGAAVDEYWSFVWRFGLVGV